MLQWEHGVRVSAWRTYISPSRRRLQLFLRAVKFFGQLLISEHDSRCFRILGDKILSSVHLIIQLIWSWKRMILQQECWRGSAAFTAAAATSV